MPPLASVLGLVLRDVLLTADEYRAMADGLADTDGPATGSIALSSWIRRPRATRSDGATPTRSTATSAGPGGDAGAASLIASSR